VVSGALYDAIDTIYNADISVCYKTVKNYKKKIANAYLKKHFAEKINIDLITLNLLT